MTFSTVRRQARLAQMGIGLVVLLASATSSSIADTFPQQPGVKILHYTFDVTLSDASDEISVMDTVDLQFLAPGVNRIDLNLCNLIREAQAPDRLNPCFKPVPNATADREGALTIPTEPLPASVGRGMTVTEVTADGKPLLFKHENNLIHIDLPTGYSIGDKFSFTVSYHGVPASGIFIGSNKYGDRVWFTDNWPNKARNWLATIDHISVKAPKTIIVTAPRAYQVISNGSKREETDLPNGMRRTTWSEAMPLPSWQYSLGVAAMAVEYFGDFHGTEFSAWAFPQDRDIVFQTFDRETASIFEFYSDHIGPYSYEKLAHVEAVGEGGATEPATSIFYYGTSFGAASHEMAHQWFGDAVTERNWDDVWLSEGFATYLALLFIEHQDGHDAFMASLKRSRDAAVNYALSHPTDTIVHENLNNDSNVFSNSTQIYQGGAMVLHTLRGLLGDDTFWAGLRLYYTRFRNGSASTDDLRRAMEDACNATEKCPQDHQNLSWFFQEWLHRGGMMQLKGNWHYDAESRQLKVTLDQGQTQGLYRMPMEIGITLPATSTRSASSATSASGRKTVKLLLDAQHAVETFPLDTAPLDVQLDPNTWVPLMQAAFERQ